MKEGSFDFTGLFEYHPVPSWIYNVKKKEIVSFNKAAFVKYGYSKEEFEQLVFSSLPDNCEDQPYLGQFTHLTKKGDRTTVKLYANRLSSEDPSKCLLTAVETSSPAEQRLRLLESVITHTNDAVIVTEAEPTQGIGLKIVYVNEAFTRMTGYTAEEVLGRSPALLQGKDTDMNEVNRLSDAIRNWKSCEVTLLNYKKSGEPFWIQFTIIPVADSTGWYTHWIAIERDVTAQAKKEQEYELTLKISQLFNQEAELNNILENMCEEITSSLGGAFAEVWLPTVHNNQLKQYAGYASTTSGQLFYQASATINRFDLQEGLPGTIWTSKQPLLIAVTEEDVHFIRRDAAVKAGIRWLTGIPLFFLDKLVGVMITGTSTSKEESEKLLTTLKKLDKFIGAKIYRKRMEQEFQLLFDSLPDLICTRDINGRILKINKAGAALLEYSEAELLGQPITKYISPTDLDQATTHTEKLLSEGVPVKYESRFLTKSGKVIWLSWNCIYAADEGLVFCSAKDITTEKKLIELVEDANSMARIGGWEIDRVKQTIYWSYQVHSMHGTDPGTYQPNKTDALQFYREDFRPLVKEKMGHTIKTGEPLDYEAVIITTAGKELWVRVIGRTEWYEGNCIRLYGSFQDIHDRKTTELTLQSLTDDLPGVTFQYLVYPDGKDELRSVNKKSTEIWGFPPEECIRNLPFIWGQIQKTGDMEGLVNSIQESIKTQKKWHHRWRYIMPDGREIWHEGYGTPYFYSDGTVLFNSMIFDVTEEKKAIELYEETSQMARVGSWEQHLTNNEGDATYWSPMMKEILEVDEQYNPSLSGGFEFYEGEYQERIRELIARLIKDQQPFDEELQVRTAKGRLRWVRCIGKGEFRNGTCVRILGSYQDIHDRKSLELERATILESIGDAFIAVDNQWVVTYWNKMAEEVLFKKKEEIVGKSLWVEYPNAQDSDFYRNCHQAMEAGQMANFEEFYPRLGKWLEVTAYPADTGLSVYFKDITYRKKMEDELRLLNEELKEKIRELELANEELEQFAFIASHDLQEPLRMVSSFMDLLQRKYESQLDSKAQQYIHFAIDGAKRMKKIILDLLDYSRAGRFSGNLEEVNLEELVTEYKYLRTKLLAEKQVKLVYGELPVIRGYKVPLVQVLHALLDNAIKYSRTDQLPEISILVEEKKKEWIVGIRDNGIGIDPQYFDKIFVIFQRLHNRDQYEGTGIGLAIVKKQVENWGGRIWVESEPGKGSTFYFTINK